MCMSSVYLHQNGSDNLVADYVKEVAIDNDACAITLTDVMGKQTTVSGIIRSIDLVKNIISIEERTA